MTAIKVDKKHQDYEVVRKRLQDSNMEMTKMLKLNESPNMQIFDQEKNIMMEHLKSKNGVNEATEDVLRIADLFHGTCDSLEQVLNEGLDARSRNYLGHFGRGIYFSDDPEFARIASESSGGSKVIYMCKVILGNSKAYPNGRSDKGLTREPREVVDKKKVVYDSVEGTIGGYKQYVVYERRRVLVQYALYYDSNVPLPSYPQTEEVSNNSGQSSCDDDDGDEDDNSENDDDSSSRGSNESFHTPNEDECQSVQRKKKHTKRTKNKTKSSGKVATRRLKDKTEVIRKILINLMSSRNSYPKEIFDELLTLFYKTYIQCDKENLQPNKEGEPNPKINQQITEFCSISKCNSNMEALVLLELNDFDVNMAVLDYHHITMVK